MITKLLLLFLAATPLDPSSFEYESSRPIDVTTKTSEMKDGAKVSDLTYANASGGRTAAYLVTPEKSGKGPGILFVHWYDPPSKDSNRTQFLSQAVELAGSGATSLLIETMWSEPEWFPKRDRSKDFDESIRQVRELRRALQVLLAQPGVDPQRVAYVGHDFGAMYGAVLAGIDRRVHAWALQAGTTSFSDWFLLGTKLQGDARQAVIDKLAPLDPVLYIGKASPSPVLFQFGHSDRFVPDTRAQAFFDSTREPKKILWYDAEHGLNEQAVRDRQQWLKQALRMQ